MSRLEYDLVNVFTLPGKPYTGNPLAVFYKQEQHQQLAQGQLQTVATREPARSPPRLLPELIRQRRGVRRTRRRGACLRAALKPS